MQQVAVKLKSDRKLLLMLVLNRGRQKGTGMEEETEILELRYMHYALSMNYIVLSKTYIINFSEQEVDGGLSVYFRSKIIFASMDAVFSVPKL